MTLMSRREMPNTAGSLTGVFVPMVAVRHAGAFQVHLHEEADSLFR